MTYRALAGVPNSFFREHLFFLSDFVERIPHSAQFLALMPVKIEPGAIW
jgi:hypothetical protein